MTKYWFTQAVPNLTYVTAADSCGVVNWKNLKLLPPQQSTADGCIKHIVYYDLYDQTQFLWSFLFSDIHSMYNSCKQITRNNVTADFNMSPATIILSKTRKMRRQPSLYSQDNIKFWFTECRKLQEIIHIIMLK